MAKRAPKKSNDQPMGRLALDFERNGNRLKSNVDQVPSMKAEWLKHLDNRRIKKNIRNELYDRHRQNMIAHVNHNLHNHTPEEKAALIAQINSQYQEAISKPLRRPKKKNQDTMQQTSGFPPPPSRSSALYAFTNRAVARQRIPSVLEGMGRLLDTLPPPEEYQPLSGMFTTEERTYYPVKYTLPFSVDQQVMLNNIMKKYDEYVNYFNAVNTTMGKIVWAQRYSQSIPERKNPAKFIPPLPSSDIFQPGNIRLLDNYIRRVSRSDSDDEESE